MTQEFVTLPRAVVEHVMYHLKRGDADAVCWADGVIKPELEKPQRKLTPQDIADSALLGNIESPLNACMHQEHCKRWRAQADQQHQHKPNWKLVPVEPTQAMLDQLRFGWSDISTEHVIDRWKRTIAAAPQPPGEQPPITAQSSAVEQPKGKPAPAGEQDQAIYQAIANNYHQQPQPPEPVYLLRDLAADIGVEALDLITAIRDVGLGSYSINMMLPARVCVAMCQRFFAAPQPQGEQAAVAWLATYTGKVGEPLVYVTSSYELAVENDRNQSPKPLYLHQQNLNCKSNQKRLATLWGYVKAEQPQVQQEPVAGVVIRDGLPCLLQDRHIKSTDHRVYTNPQPKREPLTHQQIDAIAESMPGGLDGFLKGWGWRHFARAIEAAHNIK